jgi:plastocyanin
MNGIINVWRHILLRTCIGVACITCLAVFPVMAASLTVNVNDLAGLPLRDAVVSVVAKTGTRVPAHPPRATAIEQKDREFIPYVTVMQTGTQVTFPNRDALLHHVYSFSPAKSFEIKLYSGESPRGVLFDKAGIVTLGCNIHDWMLGYIQVVDTPYFAKTGADGRVVIADMVAGEFEVAVWHPGQRAPAVAKNLKIESRETAAMVLALDAAPPKKRFKPPLDSVKYK